MGILSKLHLLFEWNDAGRPRIVLGNDGTSTYGISLEGFVFHFKVQRRIKTMVAGVPMIPQGSAEEIYKSFVALLDELKSLAEAFGLDTIKLEDFVAIISDHASVPLCFAKLLQKDNPKLEIYGCGIHKATNLAEAMCRSVNGQEGVLELINCISKTITNSDKTYSKHQQFKSVLYNTSREKLFSLVRQVGCRYFSFPNNAKIILKHWDVIHIFFEKYLLPTTNNKLIQLYKHLMPRLESLKMDCWILARFQEEIFEPFFHMKTFEDRKATFHEATKLFDRVTLALHTLTTVPEKLLDHWGMCWEGLDTNSKYKRSSKLKGVLIDLLKIPGNREQLLKIIIKAATDGLETWGRFYPSTSSTRNFMASVVPSTNDDVESTFGLYKYFVFTRPSMSHFSYESLTIFKRNGTIEWLKALEKAPQHTLIDEAAKMRPKAASDHKSAKTAYFSRRNEVLEHSIRLIHEAARERLRKRKELFYLPLETDLQKIENLSMEDLKVQARIWKAKYVPQYTYSKKSRDELVTDIQVWIVTEVHTETIRCICGDNHENSDTIQCNLCDRWSHMECYNLTAQHAKLTPEWYCNDCLAIIADEEAPQDNM
jgi:hypothetical protein